MMSPKLIRFADLEPSWAVKRATEPGYLRWLVSWMGGPPGYINFNPGIAAECGWGAAGLMVMPQGNRQAGLHTHGVTEIYLILKGEVESFDHTGVPHRAGPMDCLYIPAGVPHGVRTVGTEDVHLAWVHDAPERTGVSVYRDEAQPGDSDQPVQIVRLHDQAPQWTQPGARQGGTMRWQIGYVGSGPGEIANTRVRLGVTFIPSGNRDVVPACDEDRLFVCVSDRIVARCDLWTEALSTLDAVHVPAGAPVTFWNPGDGVATLLWLEQRGNAERP